jgi:dynein regulatory complex protein 1
MCRYVREIKQHSTEIDMVIDRMHNQHKEVRTALTQELEQIERAFMHERNNLIQKCMNEVESILDRRRQCESKFLETHGDRADEHISLLETLRQQDAEDFNLTKIKLETDIQVLEQQLQQMRATYQLNGEKLEYNFQVLKKRDEENNVTIIAQKRKINKLNDVVNVLRVKLQKQEEHYQKEFAQLADDYKRIMDQFKELQKKYRRFKMMDERKFQDLSQMNEEDVQELLRKILTADRIIWEQQLGMAWSCPSDLAEFLVESGAADDESDSDDLASPSRAAVENQEGAVGLSQQDIHKLFSSSLTKRILDLITAEASAFLVEDKLQKLVAPLSRDEQNLMKLDSIFKAVGIQTVQDVERLEAYFVKNREGKSDDQVELIPANDVVKTLRRFIEDTNKTKFSQKKGHRRSLRDGRAKSTDETRVDGNGEEEDDLLLAGNDGRRSAMATESNADRGAFWQRIEEMLNNKQFVWTVRLSYYTKVISRACSRQCKRTARF